MDRQWISLFLVSVLACVDEESSEGNDGFTEASCLVWASPKQSKRNYLATEKCSAGVSTLERQRYYFNGRSFT